MPLSIEEAQTGVALSPAQKTIRSEARLFVREQITPHADRWDREECLPSDVIRQLRNRRYLGAPLPEAFGGQGMDSVTYGLLTEELARGCSSVRSLLTVHDMVAMGVCRWGSRNLKAEFARSICSGERLCALALSEPNVGSDAAAVETNAQAEANEYILNGAKKWITFGQIADLFLVLARLANQPTAFLVPRQTPGLICQPLRRISGTRASMLAKLEFSDCRIPASYIVGRPGLGLSHVIAAVLDQGRYSVAWGSVGIAQACLDACLDYTSTRKQFGVALREHQLVSEILTNMIVDVRAARLLCYRAGYLRNSAHPDAIADTLAAKYFASRAAVRAANDAVQLHGANGIGDEYPVSRYLRDAKVMEIIEGSTQIQQIAIARNPPGEM